MRIIKKSMRRETRRLRGNKPKFWKRRLMKKSIKEYKSKKNNNSRHKLMIGKNNRVIENTLTVHKRNKNKNKNNKLKNKENRDLI